MAAQISSARMKQIVAIVERRKPSDYFIQTGISRRHFEKVDQRRALKALAQAFQDAGIDLQKLKQSVKRPQRDELRKRFDKLKKQSAGAFAKAEKSFRYGIEERRRSTERLATLNLPSQPLFVYIESPFLIRTIDTNSELTESNTEPWNSTAGWLVEVDGPADRQDAVNFYFAWRNDIGQDAMINAQTALIVRGLCSALADPPYPLVPADVLYFCDVNFQIIQTWTNPPSSPLSDPSQVQFVTWLNPHATLFGDMQQANIYRGYVLQHSNFFSVPHDAIVLFEVGVSSLSLVQGGGGTFAGLSLLCPFVELQVLR